MRGVSMKQSPADCTVEDRPVQRIVLHAQIITRKVAGWISQIVILIPQQPFIARWSGNHFHFDGQFHLGHTRLRLTVLMQHTLTKYIYC